MVHRSEKVFRTGFQRFLVTDLGGITEADQMEGVALAQCCSRLVGHAGIVDRVRNQLHNARLPGGLLLHGPRGIGKASAAYHLSRIILEQTGDEDFDRVHRQISAGAHPNLFVLRPLARENGKGFYSEIRVSEVRGILQKLMRTRGRCGNRILIVDSVDDCNVNAANALLKTLEEPPPDTHIMLISHRSGGLLATIRSRCQAFAMRPLSDEGVRSVVTMQRGEPDGVSQAIEFARGRPRRAFEYLGLNNNSVLQELTRWLNIRGAGERATAFEMSEKLARKNNDLALAFAKEQLRDWIGAKTVGAAHMTPHERKRLASLNQLWEKANSLFADMDEYNLDRQASLMVLFDQIILHRNRFPEIQTCR